jgi:hypothetical protein
VTPCPPALLRRAVAFDRVIEALRAVAELEDSDLAEVSPVQAEHSWIRTREARRHAQWALGALAPADRALNAELEALDR